MRNQAFSWDVICKTLNISKTHLFRLKKKMKWKSDFTYTNKNVNRTEYRTLTPQKKRQAIQLRRQGMFWQDIANKIDVNLATLYRHGLPHQKIRQNVRTKYTTLTLQRRKLAIRLRQQGMFWNDIANKIGVSPTTLYRHGLPHQKIRQSKK